MSFCELLGDLVEFEIVHVINAALQPLLQCNFMLTVDYFCFADVFEEENKHR